MVDRIYLGALAVSSGLLAGVLLLHPLPRSGKAISEESKDAVDPADLPMGRRVESLAPWAGGKKPAKGYLIVAAGGCTQCNLHALDVSKLDARREGPALVVFDGRQLTKESSRVALSPGVTRFIDRDGSIHRELNAFWVPRLFRVDGSDRLVAAQSLRETPEEFLARTRP